MFKTLGNAWKIPELRRKLIFTIFILLLYRIGNRIPVPGVDVAALRTFFDSTLSTTVLGFYNTLSGSAFSEATILALSIQPYINASIIIQLLTIAIPALEKLSKEGGEEGRKKIEKITRYTTVGLGLLMGVAYTVMLSNYGILADGITVKTLTGFIQCLMIVLTFTAGSALVMWLGEQITEFGIGNGISIILFANIVSRFPDNIINTTNGLINGTTKWWAALIMVVGVLALVVLIVFVNDAERRIPIQYAKRVVGRKIYGGQNTNLPIKVNMSGVLPVIFAQSIVSLPATIIAFANPSGTAKSPVGQFFIDIFQSNSWFYALLYFILIFAFSYFYAAVQYDPVEISNNLKKNGGFIPGFRPGKPTADFIRKIISKLTLYGAVYLGVVALLPMIAGNVIPNASTLAIGGTSVIIVVGVALETVKALEAQMLMRHYKGFLD